MLPRLKRIAEAVRNALVKPSQLLGNSTAQLGKTALAAKAPLLITGVLVGTGYLLASHPPMESIKRGELGIRSNRLTGGTTVFRDGSVVVIPGFQEMYRFSLRDHIYRPTQSARADGEAPFQSVEGLSLGIDLAVRYALDPNKVSTIASSLPEDIDTEIVEPAVQGVIFKIFARYTVREIFSTKRAEIQQEIENELKPHLAADGVQLRAVQIGNVDLPSDYRAGMERLLAEELAADKMRYTLELKSQQVKESELEAEAQKVRREKAAQASASEQIIAARAQEEAMKHVLPFKQKQIEQRHLEAEAEKVARIKTAEATAESRRIEAAGEADSRKKLADAEVYRMEGIGKSNSEQMARDGELLSKHPLLIQKTLADKLSDKVSVIIAPAPTDGSFIGSSLLGSATNTNHAAHNNASPDFMAINDEELQ